MMWPTSEKPRLPQRPNLPSLQKIIYLAEVIPMEYETIDKVLARYKELIEQNKAEKGERTEENCKCK